MTQFVIGAVYITVLAGTWIVYLLDRRAWANERRHLINATISHTAPELAMLERVSRRPKPVKSSPVDIDERVPVGL